MFDDYFAPKDFSLYYTDCIFVCNYNDEKRPAYITSCSNNGTIKATVFLDKDVLYTLSIPWSEKEEVLDFTPLQKGAINMSSSVLYLRGLGQSESPWKYKKLPNTHDTQVVDPFKEERTILLSPPVGSLLSGQILNGWVQNTFVPAHEAIKNVLNLERLAQAWSPDWYIGLHFKTNSLVIYRRNFIIGRVDKKTGEIRLKPAAHSLSDELFEFGLTVRKISS